MLSNALNINRNENASLVHKAIPHARMIFEILAPETENKYIQLMTPGLPVKT